MVRERKGLLMTKLEENYSDVSDFVKRSGVPLAFETVRRAVYVNKKISVPARIILWKYLGFTQHEIKEMLLASKEDEEAKDFPELMGNGPEPKITDQEKALLQIYRLIKDKSRLAEQIDIAGKLEGLDLSKHIMKLGKKGRG